MAGFAAAKAAAYDAAARGRQRQLFLGMSAHDRHRKMVHDLAAYYGAQLAPSGQSAPEKTDYDILRENFRFIRSEEDDASDSWEVRLAKRYYSKLFKEYAIADLSRYKEGKVGLRWRTQREVVNGVGQFVCGAKGCSERRGLASFEVPFAYQEAGERKQVLVKLRVCAAHAYQLNYRKHKEAERAHKQRRRQEERRQRRRSGSDGREKGQKKRRRGDSSSGSSGDDSSDSPGSASREGEGDKRSSSRKRAKRSSRDGEPEQGTARGAPAGGDASGAPADQDFEAFFKGLFE